MNPGFRALSVHRAIKRNDSTGNLTVKFLGSFKNCSSCGDLRSLVIIEWE